jgi:hypothetical protein
VPLDLAAGLGGDIAYVLVGPAERDKLYDIAQAAYDQIGARSASQGG